MRRILACLVSVGLVLMMCGGTWLVSGKGEHGGGATLQNFSDNFSGTLANWTTDAGTWFIDGGRLANNTANAHCWIHYNTACATNNQYVKFTIFSNNNGWVGPRFRATGGTSYYFHCRIDAGSVAWKDPNDVTVQSGTLTLAQNSVLGMTIEGSGTSTVVRVWLNPTGLPTSTSNWNGDTTPDLTFTNDPVTTVDSGSFVGFAAYSSNVSGELADDFFGGDCP